MTANRAEQRLRSADIAAALELVARTIERAAPAIRWLIPRLTVLVVLSAASALLLGWLAWQRLAPLQRSEGVILVPFVVLLLAPAVILLLYLLALRDVVEIPERLRTLPEIARSHQLNVRDAAREVRARPGPRSVWATARVVYRAKDDLAVYVPLIELLNPLFTVLAILAIPASVVITAIALLMLSIRLV